MDMKKSTPQGSDSCERTPLETAAIALHETYLALIAGDFTEKQALTIIAQTIAARG
jgi:hypothetical protein